MMHTIPTRQYTGAFQDAAVKQVLEGGRAIREVARSLEMPAKTLGNWVRRTRKGETRSHGTEKLAVSDVQAELSRLRAENVQLKMDKDILKKAAAYFVRESR
ncbi:MAG: transposase [Nitrospirales bacterium]|nr:MAG: transposase [Nitrospirales bacterium]